MSFWFDALLLSCSLALAGCIKLPVDRPTITVLCYHTFDSAKKTPYTVSRQRFDEEMRYLQVQRIPVIPFSALTDYLYNSAALSDRGVVITIDDGYKTAKNTAWPILQKYGYPFTLFVYPHAISRFRSALTWNELREMAHPESISKAIP